MSVERYAFDTNILFYAIDPVAGELHLRARRMLSEANPFRTLVLLQTLGELCYSVGRKRPDLITKAHSVADELANTFEVRASATADLREAIGAQQQHGLPFWDAMLWATARRAGCTLLFSEDLQDGRTLGGVLFRNPFAITDPELATLLR